MASTSALAATAAPFGNHNGLNSNSNNAHTAPGKGWYFGTGLAASEADDLAPLPLTMDPLLQARLPAALDDGLANWGGLSGSNNNSNNTMDGSSNKRPIVITIDSDDDEEEEEEDRKMPAVKKRRTSGDHDMDSLAVVAMAARLQEEEEIQHAQRKQQEEQDMFKSPAGRAFVFVERMIQDHERFQQQNPNCEDMQLIGQDDMVFLAEKFVECEQDFVKKGVTTHVMLAYHYTKRQHLNSIRRDGLLSHPERQECNIHTKHGAFFGDGVYVGNNPYAFKSMGDTCLLVAIRRGCEERVTGSGGSHNPYINTVVGNKGNSSREANDEIVLKKSWQVLPILQLPGNTVQCHGRLDDPGNARLWKYHCEAQRIMDEFFNNNVPTPLVRITPETRSWNGASSSGAQQPQQQPWRPLPALLPPPPPPPPAFVPNIGQAAPAVDPFAPTPLAQIRAINTAMASTFNQGATAAANTATTLNSGATATASAATPSEREKEMRRQKERFLMFTRVLMKYLETKDPSLHSKVRAIIKDCAERNKRHEPGYESVTASMRERLKQVVGDVYWKRAEAYLAHFLAQKAIQNAAAQAPATATGGTHTSVAEAKATAPSPTYATAPPPLPPPQAPTQTTPPVLGGALQPSLPGQLNPVPPSAALHAAPSSLLATAMNNSQASGTALALAAMNTHNNGLNNISQLPGAPPPAPTNASQSPSEQKNKYVMEYLAMNHPHMHQDAAIVKLGCIKRHERKEPGYEFLQLRIEEAIKQVTGDAVWRSAELHADVKIALLPTQNVAFSSLWDAPSSQIAPAFALKAAPAAATASATAAGHPTTNAASLFNVGSITRRIRTLARSEDCSVCSCNLQRKGKILQLLRCGCMFHEGCITACLKRNDVCPKCGA